MPTRNGHAQTPVPAPAEPAARRSSWTIGRILALISFLAIAALWVYGFSPWAPDTPPDALDDESFAVAADPICEEAMAELEALPTADQADDAIERAGQIEATTAVLQTMVADLRAIAPPAGTRDGDIVSAWLDDWDTFIADRLRYADNFRNGVDQPFTVTKVGDKPITARLDGFATANQLEWQALGSCITPIDV